MYFHSQLDHVTLYLDDFVDPFSREVFNAFAKFFWSVPFSLGFIEYTKTMDNCRGIATQIFVPEFQLN